MTDPQFWWYLARASGLVAWALLSTTVVWGLLLRSGLLGRWLPWAWTAAVHRFLGVLAVLFTGLHLTGLLLDDYVQMSLPDLLVPLASSWRPVPVALGVVAGYLLLAVLGTSLLAARLPRRWWKRVHLTSYLLFWSATMHLITAGTDAGNAAVRAVVAGTVTVVLLLTLVRVARSARSARATRRSGAPAVVRAAAAPAFHPLRVAEVRRETPDAVSVRFAVPPEVAPEFRFRPGQHVLVRARIDGAVVSRPYSVCSGVADGELRIAVRELPGGRMSSWVKPRLARRGRRRRRPAGRQLRRRRRRPHRAPRPRRGRRQRHHPGHLHPQQRARRRARQPLHPRLRQPHRGQHPVRRPARRAAGALPRPAAHRPPAQPGGRPPAGAARAHRPGRPAGPRRPRRPGRRRRGLRVRAGSHDDRSPAGPGRRDRPGAPAVHTEVFSAAPPRVSAVEEGPVRLRHRGVEHRVLVTAGESVLDAGLRAGIDLPYSCRAGACGPAAPPSVLAADDETRDPRRWGVGSVVRTCQAGPLQDAIIDFDAVPEARGAASARSGTAQA